MGWVAQPFDDALDSGTMASTDLHDGDGVNLYHQVFALRAGLAFPPTVPRQQRRDDVMRAIVARGRVPRRDRHGRRRRRPPAGARQRHGLAPFPLRRSSACPAVDKQWRRRLTPVAAFCMPGGR